MIFRKQTFLGQVPLGEKQMIPSGRSTYIAERLCKVLNAMVSDPSHGEYYIPDVDRIWSEASGDWMRDEIRWWMERWCPKGIPILNERIKKLEEIWHPKPPPEVREYPPEVSNLPMVPSVEAPRWPSANYLGLQPPTQLPLPPAGEPVATMDVSRRIQTKLPPPSMPPMPSVAPYQLPRTQQLWSGIRNAPPTQPVGPTGRRTTSPFSMNDVMRMALQFGPSSVANVTPATPSVPSAMMMGTPVRLANLGGTQEDLAWFEANRGQLAQQYPDQFLIIKDLGVRGAYPDFQSAYNAGLQMFGTAPFEVKQATAQQRTEIA